MKMNDVNIKDIRSRNNPIGRWSAIGPYYAMFPLEFAFNVIQKYSRKGDLILDPFSGRGTSIFLGGVLGRKGCGIEINPLGWLYSFVKLNPAKNKNAVINRLKDIYEIRKNYREESFEMPVFYKYCFSFEVLTFLLSARANLNWKRNKVDATLMAIIVLYLHNRIGEGLSNQMQLTKAMGMKYCIDWWKKNNFISPPRINVMKLLTSRINWRYEKGLYDISDCTIIYGDSTNKLNNVINQVKDGKIKKYSLLLTSPPYYSVTDYYADQWLRLWMLGGNKIPVSLNDKHKRRFNSKEDYYNLLDIVFQKASKVMRRKSIIYVRTDAREFTLKTTTEILKKYFPEHKFRKVFRPVKNKTQTSIYNSMVPKVGEVDLVLSSI